MGANVNRLASMWLLPVVLAGGVATSAGHDLWLVRAVAEQDTHAVRALLDEGVDVNTPWADGSTPLLWAAHWNNLDTVDRLLRDGADVNATDDHGVTPLERAAENASPAMVAQLLAAGADTNVALWPAG